MKAPAGMPSAFVGQNWTTNGKKVAKWMNTKVRKTIEYTDKNGKKVYSGWSAVKSKKVK